MAIEITDNGFNREAAHLRHLAKPGIFQSEFGQAVQFSWDSSRGLPGTFHSIDGKEICRWVPCDS
jgi:hypothetical protein